MTKLSVIICTYNPDLVLFGRCLDAVATAANNCEPAEIILIDNNSNPSLSNSDAVRAFCQSVSNARIVVEQRQGLTPARLRGIDESKGDLLVFVDDDNVVAPDFFSKTIELATQFSMIGAWSGQVLLDFIKEPPFWTRKYWGLLVYRRFSENCWSNLPHLESTMPCGAGLVVRRAVADYYFELHKAGKREIQLDRKGKSLFSGGDNDLAACACDLGMGVGLFHEMIVTHIIPTFRVEKEYLLRLAEGIAASNIVFRSFRKEYPPTPTFKNRLANGIRRLLKNKTDREFYAAVLRGEDSGRKMLAGQRIETQ